MFSTLSMCRGLKTSQSGFLYFFSLRRWLLFIWCWHYTEPGKPLHKHHAGHSGEHKMDEPSYCRPPRPAHAAPAGTKSCLSTPPHVVWFPPLLSFLLFYSLHVGKVSLKPQCWNSKAWWPLLYLSKPHWVMYFPVKLFSDCDGVHPWRAAQLDRPSICGADYVLQVRHVSKVSNNLMRSNN